MAASGGAVCVFVDGENFRNTMAAYFPGEFDDGKGLPPGRLG
jgi:hypothetical protein